jgi:hypothetical protein
VKEIKTIIRDGRTNKAYGAYGAHGAYKAYKAYRLLIALLIALIGLIVLAGCSKDEEPAGVLSGTQSGEPTGTAMAEVASYVTWFDEVVSKNRTQEANKTNRAWSIPSGYMPYDGGVQPIGIAFTRNGENPTIGTGTAESPKSMIGTFFKIGDKWRTSVEDIQPNTNYQLYGYIPESPAIKYSITDYNGDNGADGPNGEYSKGAIMTLQNVPSVMPHDLCVVIGAKHGYDREHDGNSDGTNRLRMGDFSFTTSAETTGNFVFLLFDHLYAALRVRMTVHKDYTKLRKIKLKSLQLSTQAGEETTKKKTDITVKLEANDGSVSPIQKITYDQPATPYPAIDGGLEFWSSEDGEELKSDVYTECLGHFMPSGITTLILTSVYDVYDRKGNLIRKDCKATNTIVLQELLTGQIKTERGKRYTINLIVKPTYLYMLSEPDLDNPTVKIN